MEQDGFTLLMPAELKVKESVMVTRVDGMMYVWEEEEIANELLAKNNWIGDELDSMYKFLNSSTIKITFTQTVLARKCYEMGLRAFSISIIPHEIRQEIYIPLKYCIRCYQLEEHNTRKYPKVRDFKLCSGAAERDTFGTSVRRK